MENESQPRNIIGSINSNVRKSGRGRAMLVQHPLTGKFLTDGVVDDTVIDFDGKIMYQDPSGQAQQADSLEDLEPNTKFVLTDTDGGVITYGVAARNGMAEVYGSEPDKIRDIFGALTDMTAQIPAATAGAVGVAADVVGAEGVGQSLRDYQARVNQRVSQQQFQRSPEGVAAEASGQNHPLQEVAKGVGSSAPFLLGFHGMIKLGQFAGRGLAARAGATAAGVKTAGDRAAIVAGAGTNAILNAGFSAGDITQILRERGVPEDKIREASKSPAFWNAAVSTATGAGIASRLMKVGGPGANAAVMEGAGEAVETVTDEWAKSAETGDEWNFAETAGQSFLAGMLGQGLAGKGSQAYNFIKKYPHLQKLRAGMRRLEKPPML